jgi:hypothetical protein
MSAGSVAHEAHISSSQIDWTGGGKLGSLKHSNGNTELVRTQIKVPADCRATGRTEVGVHFASLGGGSAIDFVLPFKPNLRLWEIGIAR